MRARKHGTAATLAIMFWFFAAKIGVGFVVTIASARWLAPGEFALFTQLLLFSAWLNLLASGGTVNGVVQQIALVADDAAATGQVVNSALRIWAGIAALLVILCTIFGAAISTALVGSDVVANYIPALAFLSAAAGLNQLLCAILTARRRSGESMFIQTLGLLLSGVSAAWFLLNGAIASAAIAFASGPALMLVATLWRVRPNSTWLNASNLAAQMRALFAHSLAFFAVATLPPLFLFGARWIYQDQFSLAALALWLLASRISDLNTQLVGLYNTQIALPALSSPHTSAESAQILRKSLGIVVLLSVLALVGFILVGHIVLKIFPPYYAEAAPYIRAYLLGDVFRSVVSLAMFWALARNRLVAYAATEIVLVAAISVAIAIFSVSGLPLGPAIAYPAVYGLGALVAIYVLLYPRTSAGQASKAPAGPRLLAEPME